MTTLYRPVLIESAEQVETLAQGTLIYDPPLGCFYIDAPVDSRYEGEFIDLDGDVATSEGLIGATALVPIEAEEERTRPVQLYISAVHVAPPSSATKPSRRLVTPWESTS